jgi:hypothetical protein
LRNKSDNTALSDCDDKALDHLVEDSTDGNDDFGQSSNVAFNAAIYKEDVVETIVEDILDESNKNGDDEAVSHKTLLEEFELFYSK